MAQPAISSGYIIEQQLSKLKYYCYVNNGEITFCSEHSIEDPGLIFSLPLLKSVKLNNGVHAFRIMAQVENLTAEELLSSSITVSFAQKKSERLDVIILGPVKFRDKSSVNRSHLIRSDVPANEDLYNAITRVYYSNNVSEIRFLQATSNFRANKQNQ